nr:EOG090X05X4 [Cyclestheria hislopi]
MSLAAGFLQIDGSVLEGGGQILRISTALSAILGIPIEVSNIRAGRSSPGLRPQHLTGMQLVRDLTNGKLDGDQIGSTSVRFTPGKITGGHFTVDTGTAGSISLIIQAALPCLLFTDKKSSLSLKGGTNVESAPPIDYFAHIFKSIAKHFGIDISCNLVRRGFYPKGGGEVQLFVTPVPKLKAVLLDAKQKITAITGFSFVAGTIPIRVAYEMRDSAERKLQTVYTSIPIKIDCYKEKDTHAFGNGTAIILAAETSERMLLGSDGLGKPKVPAAEVGLRAATNLIESCAGYVCLDRQAQDQVIILMALAEGKSRILIGPLTLHTQTAIHVTSLLTKVEFNVIDMKTQPETFIIECEGIGHKNVYL